LSGIDTPALPGYFFASTAGVIEAAFDRAWSDDEQPAAKRG
jgi:hypothetical protein